MSDQPTSGRGERAPSRPLDRAVTLATMAPHRSVTVDLLAGQESAFTDGRLHSPPVTYLQETEAPAYALHNEKRGIGLGTKRNTAAPAADRGTVVLVTGRRTLCLVGGDDSDRVIEVPHHSVAAVTVHSGWLANRFVLATPRKQYHCWVPRSTGVEYLEEVADYVRERTVADPDELENDDRASRFTYRGRPVAPENDPERADGGGVADEAGGPDTVRETGPERFETRSGANPGDPATDD